jgi:murein DD-endopeptidase MepM/ murein hydrolase activator NlpD
MLRKIRFFTYSNSSLDFREVRFFRTKVAGSAVLIGIATLGILLLVNQFSNDLLGIGFGKVSMLNMENRLLRDQLRELYDKMTVMQKSLDRLYDSGNELRLVANLSGIDQDTRSAAVGGTFLAGGSPFLSGEAARVLSDAENLMQKLTQEVKFQRASYEEVTRQLEFNRGFFSHMPAIKPMAGPYSINGFGMRVHPVLLVYRMHPGIDIGSNDGTKVYATGDGVVRFSGRTQGGYGVVVEITHGYGYSTLYAHLSKAAVHPGMNVKRGDLIAYSGRSGLVSGPHLHYEVRRDGVTQNPVDYFFDDVDAARYRVLVARAQ